MDRLLLTIAVIVLPAGALATDLTTDCQGCITLRDFGNFGAAQLYRASGVSASAVGNDRIWVVNPNTGKRVFVDLDTPITNISLFGVQIPVPDITRMEINATWGDGSAMEIWILPVEVLASIAESIEVAETDTTPEVSEEELSELPGFDTSVLWEFSGTWGQLAPGSIYWGSTWVFSSVWIGGAPFISIGVCDPMFCW